MIKLYELIGRDPARPFSPFVWRTRMALAHKGLPFQSVPWRFSERDLIAPYGAQKVPVLLDGDRPITDSWEIASYLEDAYPRSPSLFGGESGRAMARVLNWWSDLHLVGGLFPMIAVDIPRHLDRIDAEYFIASRSARLGRSLEEASIGRESALLAFRKSLDPLRMTLMTQRYLGGRDPNYADYIMFGPFMWARIVSSLELFEEDDPLFAWRESLLDEFGGMARSIPTAL